ncbi:MAG: dihydrofolate reductase family protein [Bacteroidota bacterium]
MRKVVAAINMTLDGVFDHTAVDPDEEVHQHYADLLRKGGIALYGRITYQLMEFWRDLARNPSGDETMDDFAMVMDAIPKMVFSHTLKELDWDSATIANESIEEEVRALKEQPGKDILVGSRSLIMQLLKLKLIDELQLCIHPIIAGGGMQLFENVSDRTLLALAKTKTLSSGAVILYYEPKEV